MWLRYEFVSDIQEHEIIDKVNSLVQDEARSDDIECTKLREENINLCEKLDRVQGNLLLMASVLENQDPQRVQPGRGLCA